MYLRYTEKQQELKDGEIVTHRVVTMMYLAGLTNLRFIDSAECTEIRLEYSWGGEEYRIKDIDIAHKVIEEIVKYLGGNIIDIE